MNHKYAKLLLAATLVLLLTPNIAAEEPPASDTNELEQTNKHSQSHQSNKKSKNTESEIRDVDLENKVILPNFQGEGVDKFIKWFFRQLVYPNAAKNYNIEGSVEVKFSIEPDGTLSNIEILFSSAQCFSEEVIRVLKQSPKWTPATDLDGEPIIFTYTFPVGFKLRHEEEIPYQQPERSRNYEQGLNNNSSIKPESISRHQRRY